LANLRFALSLRDVEDLLAERALDIFYEIARQRSSEINLRECCAIKIETEGVLGSRPFWLWRGVDDDRDVLDRRRDKKVAIKLLRRLLKKQSLAPELLVTNQFRSHSAARTR
jgi:putative transposase